MKTWIAWTGVGAVLVSGAAIGALGVHLRSQREIRAVTTEVKSSPSGVRQFLLKRLTRHLDLDTVQQGQIGAIMKETQEKELQPLFEEIKPRLQESLRNAETRINELLTDEQKAKFKELSSQRDRRPPMPPEGGAPGSLPRPPTPGQRSAEFARATKAPVLYYIVRHGAAPDGTRPLCLISSWGTRVMPAGAALHRGPKFRDLPRVAEHLVTTAEESPVTVSAYLGDAFDDPQKVIEKLTPQEITALHALISARRSEAVLQDGVIFLGRKKKD
jgi:hypothetical protein